MVRDEMQEASMQESMDEEEAMLAELHREMRENDELLAKLRPQLREQEGLEEELETLRQERWRLQQLDELENLKTLVENSSGGSEEQAALKVAVDAEVGTGVPIETEKALQDMEELERELEEEMENLRVQFAAARESGQTFRLAKEKLLNEFNEFDVGEDRPEELAAIAETIQNLPNIPPPPAGGF